ncbi:hypothetical protein OEZ85_005654 [Tetradesmus obliquus]|uniref:Uncharacterized protein n=1 Tax=Tetradesmus obliquus TaxID=3088 RepID=A0ABY8UJC8_TETOB|nr:hypothetical protein OEZ85_005654 [Tetradesmus obliquus]
MHRHPHGSSSPTYLLLGPNQQQQPPRQLSQEAAAATFSSSSSSSSYIALGKVLDKHLCFHAACSLGVLDAAADAELALAAVNSAMRETHRSSRSTLLLQPQLLQPCSAVPQPPLNSLRLQLQRVTRPLPLPAAARNQRVLIADAGGDVGLLADALTLQLRQPAGCASVLVRQGHGLAVALAAIANARSVLRSLYGRDCAVFCTWKRAPDAVKSATAPAADAAGSSSHDQQLLRQADDEGAAEELLMAGITQQQQQQQQQQRHYSVPRRLYKLLVIACDPGDDMTAGWVQQQQKEMTEQQKNRETKEKEKREKRANYKAQRQRERKAEQRRNTGPGAAAAG